MSFRDFIVGFVVILPTLSTLAAQGLKQVYRAQAL